MIWEKWVIKLALRNCCRCKFFTGIFLCFTPVLHLFFKGTFWEVGMVFQKTKRGFCSEWIGSKMPPSFFLNMFFVRSYKLCPKSHFSARTEQGTVSQFLGTSRIDSGQMEKYFKNPREVFFLEILDYKNLLQFRKMCHG